MKVEESVVQFQSLTQARYLYRPGKNKDKVIVLLHGYRSNAFRMWSWFEKRIPEEWSLLAPQGPFPLPEPQGNGFRLGYSWYFFDGKSNKFHTNYEIPKSYLVNLMKQLGFENSQKSLIGFSQGGYATVQMFPELKNVQHIVGVGCSFNIDNPNFPKELKVEAVHGAKDPIVELDKTVMKFHHLPRENKGRFQIFDGVGHKPSDEMLDTAAQWVLQNL